MVWNLRLGDLIGARSDEAKVLVTERMTPLVVGGHTVHQIGLPITGEWAATRW